MASRPQIESLLQAYIDGEVSPAEKALFERELADSPELAEQVRRGREVAALLFDSLGAHKLSHDLGPAVMAHLPEMEGGRDFKRQEFVREVNWRTKHPASKARWFITVMPVVATVVLAVLGFVVFQEWPGPEVQPRVVAMLTSLAGDAVVHDAEDLATRDAALMSALHPGDTVETRAASDVVLTLPGPTTIKTPESSRLKVLGPRAVQLEKGRAWLSVAKNAERFRVRTAMGDITVFGTVFSVEVQADHVTVILQEGEVTVENRKDFTVLYPGEQAVMRLDQPEIEKQRVDAAALLAWADVMQPNAAAQEESLAAMPALDGAVMHAEQVWWVDTRDRGAVNAIAFSWDAATQPQNPMSYDVLVYNENMQPLFSRRIEGALLASPASHQLEVQIPDGESLGGTATFVRLVPDVSSGSSEVTFKEVSLIGSAPGSGQ